MVAWLLFLVSCLMMMISGASSVEGKRDCIGIDVPTLSTGKDVRIELNGKAFSINGTVCKDESSALFLEGSIVERNGKKYSIFAECSLKDTFVECAYPLGTIQYGGRLVLQLEADGDDDSTDAVCDGKGGCVDGTAATQELGNFLAFNGQSGEGDPWYPDEWVFRTFFEKPLVRNGIYLEMGAMDGLLYSNTLFFENHLNWTGMLLEPEPVSAYRLTQRRSKNVCLPLAICDGSKPYVMFTGSPGMSASGLTGEMSPEHVKQQVWETAKSFAVPCEPLGRLLKRYNFTHIDFFSLDVEGSELTVLKTMDWNVTVHVMLIELSDLDLEKENECRDILKANGFQYYGRHGLNELWANPNNARKI